MNCFMDHCCHEAVLSGHAAVAIVALICFFAWLGSLSPRQKDGGE